MTNPIGRAIAALLAAFVVWTLVRAFRRGVISDDMWTYSLDDNPMLFTIAAVAHGLGVAFLVFIAAGNDPASFWHLVTGR